MILLPAAFSLLGALPFLRTKNFSAHQELESNR
jgi:hypothetical protein